MTSTVTISIQGASYDMTCEPGQEDNLLKAADLVNEIMATAKNKNISNEKAAILTSLNLASKLIKAESEINLQSSNINNIAEEQITNIINNIHREVESFVTKS